MTQLRDLISAADPDVTSSQLDEFNRQFQSIVQNIEKKALKAEGGNYLFDSFNKPFELGHLDLMATKLAIHQVQRDCMLGNDLKKLLFFLHIFKLLRNITPKRTVNRT